MQADPINFLPFLVKCDITQNSSNTMRPNNASRFVNDQFLTTFKIFRCLVCWNLYSAKKKKCTNRMLKRFSDVSTHYSFMYVHILYTGYLLSLENQ